MYLKISVSLLAILQICTDILWVSGEKCITPNNEEAECMSLYSCPVLISALATQQNASIEFVRISNCGGVSSDPKVCCGSYSFFTSKTKRTDASNQIEFLAGRQYCGYQHSDDYYRTENGTALEEFPWLASLVYKSKSDDATDINNLRCGGSLISNRYVLTASHCTVPYEHDLVAVRLGGYNITKQNKCEGDGQYRHCSNPVEEIAVEDIIMHPMYNHLRSANDIALIRLSKTIDYSDYIRPICLPEPGKTANVGDILVTSGWGIESTTGNYVNIKKRISTKLIGNSECSHYYNNSLKSISENHFCTQEVRVDNNNQYSCQGDSGGPVMFSIKHQWQQDGIVSFGKSCNGLTPEVQTRVVNYLQWIRQNVKP